MLDGGNLSSSSLKQHYSKLAAAGCILNLVNEPATKDVGNFAMIYVDW